MTTNINWISVYDQLPKGDMLVLAIVQDDEKVYTFQFDPTYGWIPKTDNLSMDARCRNVKVLFWSEYNLPKQNENENYCRKP